MKPFMTVAAFALLSFAAPAIAQTAPLPSPAAIDAEVQRVMGATGAKGLAMAIVDHGQATYVHTWGARNAAGDPLTPQTVMYGASVTKAVFAWTVMQMAQEGVVDLDKPIADYLSKPLPDYYDEDLADRYADYRNLASDPRWRTITPRMLLTHSSGFANFFFLEPDEKGHIHFDPGSRYAYSGEGMILMQFALEQGLGLDIGAEMQRRVFDRFGMANTSMQWRPDFANNLADGWDAEGKTEPHDERSKPRAAGSMDTTITDLAAFTAGFMRGEGLNAATRAEMLRPQLPITTRGQFPTLQPELPADQRRPDLSAGLGVVTFSGPQGPGFYKNGHDDITANVWVCLKDQDRCVIILANDVRAEDGFASLIRFMLGDTGYPADWELGPRPPV
jgi:CubicO group peptidase (beta-lactamase class C family)